MPKKIEINLNKKLITLKSEIEVKELYSNLMDIFDEPEYMRHDLPIEAFSKYEFKLINGWKIDQSSTKFIKGSLVTD